ncbi:hypothetical protein GcM3_104007 [Golovinomyces cichoracearum]|uniref:Uncharacterized protein n=1 Tax=Golovinomyces cichoracearum TaxID=62708 RepID=A0A420I9X3_9PEZI|nr:hypothetical protein GcM3_104007 [Golovinomyces cichoracearum]
MTKSEEKEISSPARPLAVRLSWSIIFFIPIFLISIILINIHFPFNKYRVYPSPSNHVEKPELLMPELEEIRKEINPKTEEVLQESIRLFTDILTHFSEDLNFDHSKGSIRKLEARGLVSEIQNFFSGNEAGSGLFKTISKNAGEASKFLGIGIGNGTITGLDLPPMYLKKSKIASQKASGINNIAENLGQGLSSSVVGLINIEALKPSPQSLGFTSRAFGEGAGSGAAAGLNLKALDTKAFNNTGLPGIVGNLAQGLTSSFFEGVDVKANLMSAMGNFSSAQANAAALSLAQGLGSGAAYASKLISTPPEDAYDKEGIDGIAGSLGQGLTTSFIRGIDIQKIRAMVQGNITPEQTNQAALALAQGLGSGAAFATKLSTTPPAAFDKNGISGVAGSVGQGLSTSFLQDINFKALASSMMPMLTPDQILEASAGLGTGLAEGAVVGIGLQTMTSDSETNRQGVGPAAEEFARGLSQSFLANGTALKILGLLKQGNSASSINLGAVAKGFGIGLVGGAEISFENAGGVATIFKISPEDAAQITKLPMVMTTVNDTVGGAATGFGSGLGLETTKFVLQLLGKPVLNSKNGLMSSSEPETNNMPSPETPVPTATTQGPNVQTNTTLANRAIVSHFNNRQIVYSIPPTPTNSPAFSSSTNLDLSKINETVNPFLKIGADRLGCQGLGGLVAVLLALRSDAGQIDVRQLFELQKPVTNKLNFTDQIFTIKDSKTGNRLDVNAANFKLSVNGNSLKKEFILLVFHIFLGVVTFAIAIPIVLIINSSRNFALLCGRTDVLKNASKIQWTIALAIILPSSLAVVIFGLLADGTRNHFYSSHGVMGAILILLTLLAFPLAYLRPKSKSIRLPFSINIASILSLTAIVLINGFVDLSAISFCVAQFLPQFVFVLFGTLLSTPLLQSVTMITLELLIDKWKVSTFRNMRNSDYFLDNEKARLTRETNPFGVGGNKDNFMEI